MSTHVKIEIKRLSSGDGEVYRTIRLQALENAPNAFGSSLAAEADRPSDHFEARAAQGGVFAAFVDGRVIGMAGFYVQSGPKVRHKGTLWGMYIAHELRGCGAGKLLVQAVLDHARGLVDLITLAVVSDNASALALYEHMGFRIYGVEPHALKIGSDYFSECLMIQELDTPKNE